MADKIEEVKNNLREKIAKKETDKIDNDLQYYFAIGQAVKYMHSQNKSAKKDDSIVNNFVNCKSDKRLKQLLGNMYKKYNYTLNSTRFKNLFAMINSYETNSKIESDILLAGFLHSNVLFEKIENKEDK